MEGYLQQLGFDYTYNKPLYEAICSAFQSANAEGLLNFMRLLGNDFLSRGHINAKYDCHTCWARPLCAGGCHHEAFVRYGDTGHPNLHYCDWIRAWTNTCLEVYGTLAEKKPEFLEQFN